LRQDNAESCAVIDLSPEFERASMFLDDARGNGKAKASPRRFGAEERIEQSLLYFRRDPFACVLNLHDDHRKRLPAQTLPSGTGT